MTDRPLVLREIRLQRQHRPTSVTRHFGGGEELPPPVALRIVRYDDAPGYYLIYLNEADEEQTDTWHESLEAALDEAEREFNVGRRDWSEMT